MCIRATSQAGSGRIGKSAVNTAQTGAFGAYGSREIEEETKPGGPKGYIDMLGTVLALTPPARRGKKGLNSHDFPASGGWGDKGKQM